MAACQACHPCLCRKDDSHQELEAVYVVQRNRRIGIQGLENTLRSGLTLKLC